jgi:hypothetical protein
MDLREGLGNGKALYFISLSFFLEISLSTFGFVVWIFFKKNWVCFSLLFLIMFLCFFFFLIKYLSHSFYIINDHDLRKEMLKSYKPRMT